jgi:hypothetical protein
VFAWEGAGGALPSDERIAADEKNAGVTTPIRRASKANLKAVFGAEFSEEKPRKEQGRPKKAPGNAGVGGGLTNRSRTERNMLAKSRGWEETVVYTRLYSIKLYRLLMRIKWVLIVLVILGLGTYPPPPPPPPPPQGNARREAVVRYSFLGLRAVRERY